MNFKSKNKFKGKKKQPQRFQYSDGSKKFVDWVNQLGFEKTFLGKIFKWLDTKLHIRTVAVYFFFALVVSFIITADIDYFYSFKSFRRGDLAPSDIKSPINLEIIDEIATAEKRKDAEEVVPPVFDYDPGVYDGLIARVFSSFRAMRKKVLSQKWPKDDEKRQQAVKDFVSNKAEFESLLKVNQIPQQVFEWLVEKRFSAQIENALVQELDRVSNLKVANDLGPVKDIGKKSLIARVVERGGGGEEFTLNLNFVKDLYEVRNSIDVDRVAFSKRFTKLDRRMFTRLSKSVFTANLTFNRQETADRRQRAREAVLPVVISIKRGQVIVNQGSLIQPLHVRLFNEIRRKKTTRYTDFIALIMALLMVSLILIYRTYLGRFTRRQNNLGTKDFMAMSLVTIVVLLGSKVFYFLVTEALRGRPGLDFPDTAFMYLMPMVAAPILVGLLVTSGEIAWLYTMFFSVAASFMFDNDFTFMVVTSAGGIFAVWGVYKCKKRNDIYKAGVKTGLILSLMIGLFTLLNRSGESDLWLALLVNSLAGFFSGILSSLVVMMLVPLVETIFNYTTDVKLLELGNLNHPLLREMIVKAPGTYHHSLVVGNMCEAAAENIGANPLLAKVSSYYHDIGKTGHAAYFFENQKSGYNPHDHISPHMSKTVLIAHVKDGVDLAIKYKLGKPIIDVIVQHHGTTLISFFYNKAKQAEDEEIDEIEEDEFRYPGPKPQYRESALCMLADSIEAAARSLDDPTPMRLQNIVKNIIHRKFMDGQLDECSLTLRDLTLIEESFTRILLGIYHQRIDYPRAAGGGASETPPKGNVSSL